MNNECRNALKTDTSKIKGEKICSCVSYHWSGQLTKSKCTGAADALRTLNAGRGVQSCHQQPIEEGAC